MYVNVFPVFIYVHHVPAVWRSQEERSEEGIRFTATGCRVVVSPCGCWELKHSPLQVFFWPSYLPFTELEYNYSSHLFSLPPPLTIFVAQFVFELSM